MDDIQLLMEEYDTLMSKQVFAAGDLDYTLLEKHKLFATNMAFVGNSGVTIFDLYRREHVFSSYNFGDLFGYNREAMDSEGNDYFNSRIHPDDFVQLLKNGIETFRLYYSLSNTEKVQVKSISEYRIKNGEGKYIRVIEQHQVLELDKSGNVWLSLGIMDVSPNQENYNSVHSSIINFKTGEVYQIKPGNQPAVELSAREKQILGLIKDGYLSKEISGKLLISVHTVNTHRQRILQKLNANNSLEAVRFAAELGLLT
jgi:DNA-binding CsgD family transcriptional regulator